MYKLMSQTAKDMLPVRPANTEYHCVFDTVRQTGAPHFVHGAAVRAKDGEICVSFAFNENAENSLSERLLFTRSRDGGATWTAPSDIARSDGWAHSHGVFLQRDGRLWCFAPAFRGLGDRPVNAKGHRSIAFTDLHMEAYVLSDGGWQNRPCSCPGFWPLNAPLRLCDGSLLISGCSENWYAAAAVSRGDDLSAWRVIRPDTHDEIFTEAAAWAQGDQIMLLMRNETLKEDGLLPAAVSLSSDGGKSFGACVLSDLPMAASKPFCGRLKDGRPYLLFNAPRADAPRDRSLLLLGVGDGKAPFSIDRLYMVDEGARTKDGRRFALAYPSACESLYRLLL